MVFTIASENIDKAREIFKENEFGAKYIVFNEEVAKLSVVGAGLEANPKIGSLVFETLFKAGINIDMISTAEIKMSLIIDKKDADKGVELLHNVLINHL